MKKYGEDVAIVEENPKIEKIYDNNMRQGEEIVIKREHLLLRNCTTKISTDNRQLKGRNNRRRLSNGYKSWNKGNY